MADDDKSTRKPRMRKFGTILQQQKPSGRPAWRARWFEGRTGRRMERTFDTEKEARRFLAEVETRLLTGSYSTPPRADQVRTDPVPVDQPLPAFCDHAKEVLDQKIAPVRAPATVDLYQANLKALTRFFGRRHAGNGQIPPKRLDEITPSAFQDYRAWRLGAGGPASPATVNREQQFVSVILNMAVVDGIIEVNPLRGLKKLREPRKPRRFFEKEEVAALLNACDKHFRPLVLAALFTGARFGELRALRWQDINLDTGKIELFRSKVGNADRLDIHPELVKELGRLKKSRPKADPSDFIFLSRRNTPWVNIRKSWSRAMKAAKLHGRDGLTFHSLRHTFATFFLDGGGAVTDLRAQLGHAELSTTQRYAALVNQRRRDSVFSLDYGPPPKVRTKPAR